MKLGFILYMLASTFLPINLILAVKFYSSNVQWLALPFFFLSNIGLFASIRITFILDSKVDAQQFRLENIQAIDEDALVYVVTYIPAFLTLVAGDAESLVAALVFYTFVSIVYVRSRAIFTNPIFMLFGWRFYKANIVSDGESRISYILAKRSISQSKGVFSLRRLSNLGTYALDQ